MSSLNNLYKRLDYRGGSSYVDRMNKDKLRSLKKSLCTAYQSATAIMPDGNEFRCLINPNKLNNDYDVKILSIPYENVCVGEEDLGVVPTNIAAGQVIVWKENWTHWLVYLQHLEETAYFRAEMRRCRFTIDINGKKYWVYLRGPVENGMVWGRSGNTYFNKLNETAFMYVQKNEETEQFFQRFTKLKVGNQMWEVQATDKISVDGIIEVALKEDFTNKFPDKEIQEIVKEDTSMEPMIIGKQTLKPYDAAAYELRNIAAGGIWSIVDSTAARIQSVLDDKVIVEVTTGKSGQFTLKYTLDDTEIILLVKILSL